MLIPTLLATTALAQGTIADGATSFGITDFEASGAFRSNFLPDGGLDRVYDTGWFVRFAPGTSIPFGAPTSESYVGNVAVITWDDLGGEVGVDATLTITLDGVNGFVTQDLVVTNNSSLPVTDLAVFAYIDADLNGSAGGDVATVSGLEMTVSDGADQFTIAPTTANAVSYQITTYSGLRNALTTGISSLDDTGAPFGPADFTGAHQYEEIFVGIGSSVAFGHRFGIELVPLSDLASRVDAMATIANNAWGSEVVVESNDKARFRPSVITNQIQGGLNQLVANDCLLVDDTTGHATGAVRAGTITGEDDGGPLSNGSVIWPDSWSFTGSEGNDVVGSAGVGANPKLYADSDDGSAYLGMFRRVAGRRGVALAAEVTCNGAQADAYVALANWFDGPLP